MKLSTLDLAQRYHEARTSLDEHSTKLRLGIGELRREPRVMLGKIRKAVIEYGADLTVAAVRGSYKTMKNLWDNVEAVAILSLAGFAVSHFIGEIAIEHAALSFLLAAELLSPVLAVLTIWFLLAVALWRRERRLPYAS